jgi:hypothetical protein
MDKERNCFNCKWSRYSGLHLGCFYKNEYIRWLPQKLAKRFALCELEEYKWLVEIYGMKWEEKKKMEEID